MAKLAHNVRSPRAQFVTVHFLAKAQTKEQGQQSTVALALVRLAIVAGSLAAFAFIILARWLGVWGWLSW
jgi:hypothetical protein